MISQINHILFPNGISSEFIDMKYYSVYRAIKKLADSKDENELIIYNYFSKKFLLFYDHNVNGDLLRNSNSISKQNSNDNIVNNIINNSLNNSLNNSNSTTPTTTIVKDSPLTSPRTSANNNSSPSQSLRDISIRSLKLKSSKENKNNNESLSNSNNSDSNLSLSNSNLDNVNENGQQQRNYSNYNFTKEFYFQNAIIEKLFHGGHLFAFHSLFQSWNPAIVCEIIDDNNFIIEFTQIKMFDGTVITPDMNCITQVTVDPHFLEV
jgi:hypothetical protein